MSTIRKYHQGKLFSVDGKKVTTYIDPEESLVDLAITTKSDTKSDTKPLMIAVPVFRTPTIITRAKLDSLPLKAKALLFNAQVANMECNKVFDLPCYERDVLVKLVARLNKSKLHYVSIIGYSGITKLW